MGLGRTVVVGMKMDAQSRELLTWALVKVAVPGDVVVALHVLPLSSLDGKSCSCTAPVVKSFDSVLAVYEGFCNLKQIDLKLHVCRGSSIRRSLVREAESFSSVKLILGTTKNSGIGLSSFSTAKYCAKKLTTDCSVLVVKNGKIVFERESKGSNNGNKTKLSSSKSFELLQTSNSNSFCLLPTNKYGHRRSLSVDKKPHRTNESLQRRSSISVDVTSRVSDNQVKEVRSLAMVLGTRPDNTQGPMSQLIQSLPEAKPGWPLLKKAVLNNQKSSLNTQKLSVVQWAMQLPNRYSSSAATVHPNARLERKVTGGLDSKSGAIVPIDVVSPRLSDADIAAELAKLPKQLEALHEKYASTCRLFNFQELADATSNFSDDKFIGKGGNSRVYKGILPDGRELAVKILKQSEEVLNEFTQEIEVINALHHKNVISLFGYCCDGNNLLLVYDFLTRGSLEENLHGARKTKDSIGWSERYKVAIGVAEALDYLHGCGNSEPVIHRDVKSSNILLSEDFDPQLSDFGLAMWASSSSSHTVCSDVAGTFGYLAPEYFMFGKVSEKVDVYAFGVVLLELLSGRKPIENHLSNQKSLVMWAKPILQSEKPTALLDPNLGSKYDEGQRERMILAASLCIRRAPRLRPKISTILKLLQGTDKEVMKWATFQVKVSDDLENLEDEKTCSNTDFQSHINLALLDVEDDEVSVSSADHSAEYIMSHSSLEAYLQGRWSRSSSFD